MTEQQANVAGLFYPADAAQLAAQVDSSLGKAKLAPVTPKAVIAPHAGYVYSGDIAGAAYRLLGRRKGEIRRVVLMGPNHRAPVRGVALSPADTWRTPLGALAVDRAGRDALARQQGVSVAAEPFTGEHSLETHLPFIHRALGEVEILPMLVGDAPEAQVSSVLEQLWGGPETAIVVSSDLSHFHDYQTCQAKDEETARGIERLQSAACVGDRACGRFAIAGLLDQARRRDLRVTALDVRNSGDTHGPRDRVVGYGAFGFEYAHAARLDAAARAGLVDLAKRAVRHAAAHGGKAPSVNINGGLARPILAQRATFVTLSIDGKLRGCCGSLGPQRSLYQDVVANAVRSGFGDPRFSPLSADELDKLEFHISILSTPRRIACASETELVRSLRPDVDGLIIRDGDRQAIFLPSVWAQLPDAAAFVRHLKVKAGMAADHWSPKFEAYRYTTESFGDPAGHA